MYDFERAASFTECLYGAETPAECLLYFTTLVECKHKNLIVTSWLRRLPTSRDHEDCIEYGAQVVKGLRMTKGGHLQPVLADEQEDEYPFTYDADSVLYKAAERLWQSNRREWIARLHRHVTSLARLSRP